MNSVNKFYKNIHLPASVYFTPGYIPEFQMELLKQINYCEKNSIQINHICMNENTYNWMFRLFNTPVNNKTYPLSSSPDGKTLYDYPIKIVSNNEMKDGEIFYIEGDKYGMA